MTPYDHDDPAAPVLFVDPFADDMDDEPEIEDPAATADYLIAIGLAVVVLLVFLGLRSLLMGGL